MASIFEKLWNLGPAAFILKAIVAAFIANAMLLAFILFRRAYRKRYFTRRDKRVFELRQNWDALISGKVPYTEWRNKTLDLQIVEAMALDALEASGPEESARLLKFLRNSGLIEKRICEARQFTGWRRLQALVALGCTRAPEGISALAEGLRDGDIEVRLAALRGLGRMASPQAGEEILASVAEMGLCIPALPLQNALIQCTAERPQILLPYIRHAESPFREVLGRVLGEVATPSLGPDLLQFAEDEIDELRAAAARGLSHTKVELALDVLSELGHDPTWFVRLRAIVSLGKLSDRRTIPTLLRGLTDANRLVRFRAAEGLVAFKTEMGPIFAAVIATRDRYGLHAYLTALENAHLRGMLEEELQASTNISEKEKGHLQSVLMTGALPTEDAAMTAEIPEHVAALR